MSKFRSQLPDLQNYREKRVFKDCCFQNIMEYPHAKEVDEIFSKLQTSEKGLNNREVNEKLSRYGKNEISKKKKTPVIFKFLKQFHSPLIYILFVAMIISFVFDHLIDAYVILAVVLVNAVIGFVQERKAERAIDALKKMVVSTRKFIGIII